MAIDSRLILESGDREDVPIYEPERKVCHSATNRDGWRRPQVPYVNEAIVATAMDLCSCVCLLSEACSLLLQHNTMQHTGSWSRLFDPRSSFKLLFSLQLLDGFMTPSANAIANQGELRWIGLVVYVSGQSNM